ncbi:hypothetical protein SAB1918 [Staphylococcus aureus RF122]|nr:hypothetical protein SAB1918 [Staphylococcus aureus RF122]
MPHQLKIFVESGNPNSLCSAPLAWVTIIEKSWLQAHFWSINYCQYNFVEPRTLILCPGLVFCVST